MAIGDKAVVCAIRIHDGKALDAFALRSGLGNVGNAAVEEGQLARELRIDGIRAFVRSTPPFAWWDHEAQPRQFLTEIDIIEVATDGQIAIAAHADKALDQLFDIAALPIIILGRGDLLNRDRADTGGTLWFEKTRVAQVGRNHFGNLAPQCGAVPGGGIGRVGCDQGGHGDAANLGGIELDQFGLIICWRSSFLSCGNRCQRDQAQYGEQKAN